jgi:hypothetical protein
MRVGIEILPERRWADAEHHWRIEAIAAWAEKNVSKVMAARAVAG